MTLLFIAVNGQSLLAQSKADVFDPNVTVTWLGVDYSQTKFIGAATKSGEAVITNDVFRDGYTSEWNQLFITEQKKYDVAKAIGRKSVEYKIDVALNANRALTKKDFFTNNPGDFHLTTEATIADAVKKYDFMNHEGIGLLFFVDGMSKGTASMGIWVTFVDMKSKTVLYTTYQTAKPGGFGFRNYWAKPLYTVLKDMEDNFKKWAKM
ncbi:hypothetical protein ACFGVR_21345 [Mucilaginibacter sp. AW1-3]